MPEFLAPGVFVEEISFRARPIEGVPTDTTGFVGMTERGPLEPQRITSWLEFGRVYGGFIDGTPAAGDGGFLPHAVRGFFDNGGPALVVVRVVGPGAAPAGLTAHLGQPADPAGAPATGLAALMALPGIALVAIPDEVILPGLADALLQACETAHDRFAIVASPATLGQRGAPAVPRPRDSRDGALVHPWVRVAAPHMAGGTRLVPPTGHVAGLIALTARERGVHKAPTDRALRGLVRGGGPDEGPLAGRLGRAEQASLNAAGVNLIIDLRAQNRGLRLVGTRTLSTDPEWRYVNVRRLFIQLQQSIEQGTQWAVFEPNTPPTWARLRQVIEEFLLGVWRAGALAGSKPQEAYFVRCDLTTMTQTDIDQGRLIALVGVAALRPAEFIIFRVGHPTADGQG